MIFSELYSAYYNTVAEILTVAVSGEISEEKLLKTVRNKAFGESVLTVVPALHEERWQLLKTNGEIPVKHIPTMPLTTLEKRWLKSLSADPRIRLFNISFNGLEDVEPLFRPEDFKVYDKYADGDPYSDEEYIKRFIFILSAIRKKQPLKLVAPNRRGQRVELNVCPEKLEYSEKDDKFRLLTTGNRYAGTVNLARIVSCEIYDGMLKPTAQREPQFCEFTLRIYPERISLERAMLHFAHFEKRAEREVDGTYLLRVRYDRSDESELVIRVLSFGPLVEVVSPKSFSGLIIGRLKRQMGFDSENETTDLNC